MAGTLTSLALAYSATSTRAMALYRRFLGGAGEGDKKWEEK